VSQMVANARLIGLVEPWEKTTDVLVIGIDVCVYVCLYVYVCRAGGAVGEDDRCACDRYRCMYVCMYLCMCEILCLRWSLMQG
jgi:hypothetical protein